MSLYAKLLDARNNLLFLLFSNISGEEYNSILPKIDSLARLAVDGATDNRGRYEFGTAVVACLSEFDEMQSTRMECSEDSEEERDSPSTQQILDFADKFREASEELYDSRT